MKRKMVLVWFMFMLFMVASASQHAIIDSTGKGPGMFFIPGLGCNKTVWDGLIQYYSRSFTCYPVSLGGFAGIEPSGEPDIEAVIDEIADYIAENNISKPVIVGHSFGGFIAMKFAVKYSHLAGKLILIDAYPFGLAMMQPEFTEQNAEGIAEKLYDQLSELPGQTIEDYWKNSFKFLINDSIIYQKIIHMVLGSDRNYLVHAQCEMLRSDLRNELNRLPVPVLGLFSTVNWIKSGLDPDTAIQRIHDQFSVLKGISLFCTQSSGHFIMLEDEGWVIDKMNNFL